MQKNVLKSLVALLLLCSTAWPEISACPMASPSRQFSLSDPVLTVTQPTPTSAFMSWTPFGNPNNPYTVTVTDLTTSKQLTTFNTYNTTATVGGLVGGHTYRFQVSKANDTIIFELVVNG